MRVFVSHAGRDRAWAEWVAWQLEHAGWDITVELDCWDWQAGDNFVAKMTIATNVTASPRPTTLAASWDRLTRRPGCRVGGAAIWRAPGSSAPARGSSSPASSRSMERTGSVNSESGLGNAEAGRNMLTGDSRRRR